MVQHEELLSAMANRQPGKKISRTPPYGLLLILRPCCSWERMGHIHLPEKKKTSALTAMVSLFSWTAGKFLPS